MVTLQGGNGTDHVSKPKFRFRWLHNCLLPSCEVKQRAMSFLTGRVTSGFGSLRNSCFDQGGSRFFVESMRPSLVKPGRINLGSLSLDRNDQAMSHIHKHP